MTNEVVVVSGVRTAVGGFGGSLKDCRPGDLIAQVVKESVKRANVAPETVGHCVIGNVIHTEPEDLYISRVAAIRGGLPEETPALTVNRLCGSGLQAVVTAAQQIELGVCDTAVAGGVEVMSRGSYVASGARFGNRLGDAKLMDMMLAALTCPIERYHMGVTAENVAEKWQISREVQDAFALQSQQKAQQAIENGHFDSQILPITVRQGRKEIEFKQDEHVRFDATIEGLEKLKPVFQDGGTVTAGNASGINDGAAALVLMNAEQCKAQGLTPRARMLGYAFAGVAPKYMGIGPVPAVQNLMQKTGIAIDDVDIWEVNEAFASQALAVVNDLGLDANKVNPNGSGISLGHPVGATGAILTEKAISELERTQQRLAVVTMCIGGGQGIAALFERI